MFRSISFIYSFESSRRAESIGAYERFGNVDPFEVVTNLAQSDGKLLLDIFSHHGS